MPRQNWGKQRDLNEPEIIERLERLGAQVIRMEDPAPFDLWVRYGASKRPPQVFHIEVKNPDGYNRMQQSQRDAILAGWPIHIVHSPEEAVAVVTGNRDSSETLKLVDKTPRRKIKPKGVERDE